MDELTRPLPSLDFLRGFEAAARHLSFTRAAAELFVTQSAVSRQMKALEDQIGVPLFRRMNRSLELTDAGQALFRSTTLALKLVDGAVEKLRARPPSRMLTVTATVSFASLWLVPRLAAFRKQHPGVDVRIAADDALLELERGDIDVAIRFCEPKAAPSGAVPFAREEVFPVCSPKLVVARRRPLRTPADLRHQVLLHLDDPGARWPWLQWKQWFVAMRVPDLEPAGEVRFSHYDQMIRAAIDGEGVALGRTPLLRRILRSRELVAPFDSRSASGRQYFVAVTPAAAKRPEARRFADWLIEEARGDAQ